MNYLLLTVLGATMFSNQQHQIVGKMVDMDTGEIILILPEKLEINKKIKPLQLSPEIIKEFIRHLSKEVSPSTQSRIISGIKSFYEYLSEEKNE